MTSKAFTGAWLVAAALLSSWAVSAAADQRPSPRAPAPAERPRELPAVSVEVEAEIARLTARTHAAPPAAPPGRNLFEFGVRRPAFEVRGAPGSTGSAAPPRADTGTRNAELGTGNAEPGTGNFELRTSNSELRTPTPELSAIADTGAGALTAVISFHDELHFVKNGDVIAGRFRVDRVSADGVDVFDLTLGTILRLSLQRLT